MEAPGTAGIGSIVARTFGSWRNSGFRSGRYMLGQEYSRRTGFARIEAVAFAGVGARARHSMPIYEYQCKKCGHRFERIQRFSDPLVKDCPECGGKVEQLLSAPAVQFKGSGWYVTDYAKKSAGGSATKAESSDGKADSSKDSGKKDSKSKAETSSKSTESK